MSDPETHRLAVFGLFGGPNLGNEATLAAFLYEARRRSPGREVTCIAPRGFYDPTSHGCEHVAMDALPVAQYFWRLDGSRWKRDLVTAAKLLTEPRRRRRTQRLIVGIDHLVVPGTGVVCDFGQGPFDFPAHMARWCTTARRSGSRVSLVSVGAERLANPLTKWMFARAVRASTYCSVRDADSSRHVAELGLAQQAVPVFPDLAFGLPREALEGIEQISWPPRRIGFGVMGYRGWNESDYVGERLYSDYIQKAVGFVAKLLEAGLEVRLILGDTRADERAVSDIVAALEPGRRARTGRLSAPDIRTWRDLLREISRTDVVIASRFHNVLLALLLERPVISLGYSRKNDALMDAAGLHAFNRGIEDFDVSWLRASLSSLIAMGDPPLERVRRLTARSRAQLEEQYDQLFEPAGDASR